MFREIKLSTYQVEAILADYVLRADLQPRGALIAYLNDRNWSYIPFLNGELCPLAADRRVGTMKQAVTTVNKNGLEILSVINEERAREILLPGSQRQVLFYTARFAVQGQLHVSSDAPPEDLLDEMHDFFPVTEAAIYPIRPLATSPTERVPLLLINRVLTQAYRVPEET